MKVLQALVFTLLIAGCGQSSLPSQSAPAQPSTKELQEKWLRSYAALTNESTLKTYKCISEMYSLAYAPVNSGPVCRDSCVSWKQVDDMVANAPAYIENPQQYATQEAKYCSGKKKRATAKP